MNCKKTGEKKSKPFYDGYSEFGAKNSQMFKLCEICCIQK